MLDYENAYENDYLVKDLVGCAETSPLYALTTAYNRGVDSVKKDSTTSSLSVIETCITKAVSEWLDTATHDEIKELIILPYLEKFHNKCCHRTIDLFDFDKDKD